MKITFGDYAVFDINNLELTIFGRKIKVRPVKAIPEEYYEPFIDVEEPKSWICINYKKKVIVKVSKNLFVGNL